LKTWPQLIVPRADRRDAAVFMRLRRGRRALRVGNGRNHTRHRPVAAGLDVDRTIDRNSFAPLVLGLSASVNATSGLTWSAYGRDELHGAPRGRPPVRTKSTMAD